MTKDPLEQAVNAAEPAPPVLLPYQQEWVAEHARLAIIEKSRRIGLSWADASDEALTAAQDGAAGGQHVWYIGYSQDMARTYIEDCAMWARHFHHAAGEVEEGVLKGEGKEGDDILIYRIKFASGHYVTALSSRPSNLRGKQGVVVIDEAAFHNKLEELLKAAMALLIWGGRVKILSTHNGDDNPFNDLIEEIRAGKRPGVVHRVTFRQAVAQGLYQRICLVTGREWSPEAEAAWVEEVYAYYGDDAAEELDCIPSSGQGAYLSRALIESVMEPEIPVVRLALPAEFTLRPEHVRKAEVADWCDEHLSPLLDALVPTLDSYVGEDFARVGDLTAIHVAQEEPNLDLATRFILELRGVPYQQQEQILCYVLDRLPRFRAAALDRTGNGGYLAERAQQRYGSTRVEGVHITTEWYREHMPRLKARIEDRTLRLPRDAGVLADYRAIRKVNGVPVVPKDARVKGPDGQYRHGDTAIAGAMLCYAVNVMEPAPIEYMAVPKVGGPFRDRVGDPKPGDSDYRFKGGAW